MHAAGVNQRKNERKKKYVQNKPNAPNSLSLGSVCTVHGYIALAACHSRLIRATLQSLCRVLKISTGFALSFLSFRSAWNGFSHMLQTMRDNARCLPDSVIGCNLSLSLFFFSLHPHSGRLRFFLNFCRLMTPNYLGRYHACGWWPLSWGDNAVVGWNIRKPQDGRLFDHWGHISKKSKL